MRRKYLFILIILFLGGGALCQNTILIPEIINFPKKTYEAGKQNRSIDQDKRGLLYFANDDGLLIFDGTYWKTYPLPNKSMVRSVAVAGDRVYVGGQQEIGYFFFEKNGTLSYQSLKALIPPGEKDFSDVWHVVLYESDVFFHSNKRIFRFHNNKITAFRSINWRFLGVSRGMLIAQQYENGLMTFRDGNWLALPSRYDFSKDKVGVRSATDFGDHKTLVATYKSGVYIIDDHEVYKFENPSIDVITSQIIHTSCAIDTGQVIIGTKLGGYYVINTNGEIVQHITKQEGLQTNTINSVYADKDRNIWLGLDNGIDLIVSNNAINHINPNYENKSPGYSAAIFKDQLYIGTGVGLYSLPLLASNNLAGRQENFTLVPNTSGLVWGLNVVDDHLLVGRNDGAYVVENNVCIPMDTSTGFWTFQPLNGQPDHQMMMAGTYNGINLYNYTAGKFLNPRIHTFFESAKYVAIMDSSIWAAHPYQGLYQISLNDTGGLVNKPYKDIHNILSSGHNHLFKIHNRIVLLSGKGIFEYDKNTGDFKESAFFKRLFHSSIVSYVKEDAQGNIWFIQDKKAGIIDVSFPENPEVIYFPEINNKILGNDEEFIYPINKNNILIAGEVGFYHIDLEKYKRTNHKLRVLLRAVTAFHGRDSTLFGGYLAGNESVESGDIFQLEKNIGYKWNSMHFEFSSPFFGGIVEYSCRLKGYEMEWTAWSKKTERSYTNLPAGEYVFEVRARNNTGYQSSLSQFLFTISPPWYGTLAAYILYFILIIAIIYFFYKRQQRKYIVQQRNKLRKQQDEFEEDQKQLQYLHQLEIEKNEKEIIRLKNIKLEAEVGHNNAVLASNTMSLLQKKELLNKIKDEILKAQEEPEAGTKTKNIRRIIKVINDELEINDDWERFSVYFDKVNNDFLKTLKENFPSLTHTDLKLCAYLRLNLSTKEIADLLNLSIRGVESSRYRLRKKLDLSMDVALVDFLEALGNGKGEEGMAG
ncbi:MAG TPA: triple tyrosine motif-containing protein [Chryseolinea sp.]|nr:triple tyrosine motif-containing protein [Chryseolinea sp.]